MAPVLFPEVIDIIIDHLYNDKTALWACSLVCQAWLDPCRFHLFHTIIIRGQPPFERFLSDFLPTTTSPNLSHLHPYVRKLWLIQEKDSSPEVLGVTIKQGDFATLFSSLPSLNILLLRSPLIDLTDDVSGSWETIRSISELTVIHPMGIWGDSPTRLPFSLEEWNTLLFMFASIGRLVIKQFPYPQPQYESQLDRRLHEMNVTPSTELSVSDLSITDSIFLERLFLLGIEKSLKILHLGISDIETMTSLVTCLRITPSHIQKLVLTLHAFHGIIDHANETTGLIDLSVHTEISTLRLELMCWAYVGNMMRNVNAAMLSIATTALASACKESLLRFDLGIYFQQGASVEYMLAVLQELDWAGLERTIVACHKLQHVGLHFGYYQTFLSQNSMVMEDAAMDSLWQLAKEKMPLLVNRPERILWSYKGVRHATSVAGETIVLD